MADLTDLYQSLILDHNRSPRNFREMEAADRRAEGHNPMCGDRLTLWLKLEDERITDVSFVGAGCAISKASASLMTTLVKGKTRAEAESLFSAALEGDHDLIVWAAGKRIMLATPASLIALLRSVSMSWQQHAQTENVRAIAEAAQELYARVCKFSEHFEKIRAGLEKANSAFNDSVGSYDRMVRPSGERLMTLRGDANGKELAEIKPLEATLRLPV